MSSSAVPVGGRVLTRNGGILFLVMLIGFAFTFWRFAVGLGPSTGLSDGYPWGIWIAFDVVTGTALACGGYAIALLVYLFNRGQYHPLVRPAILTSALGYSVAAIAIVIDVGRPWFIWRIPLSPTKWNLDSALLEVALCVMAYVFVLWVELSPAFLDKWRSASGGLRRGLARTLGPAIDKSLIWIIALGLLLPTMHQSSLGSVILLAGPRLHPLWHTPWLPLLFLISCIAMGYAVVVMETALSSRAFKRNREDGMLAKLSGVMSGVLLFFVIGRLVDIAIRGKFPLIFSSGWIGWMFGLEILLFLAPALMLLRPSDRVRIANLFRAAFFIVVAGTLYRFDAYLVAFQPGSGWSYFPSIPEMIITVGLVATEILVYLALVRRFPILGGARPSAAAK